jgi:hypothetical protein
MVRLALLVGDTRRTVGTVGADTSAAAIQCTLADTAMFGLAAAIGNATRAAGPTSTGRIFGAATLCAVPVLLRVAAGTHRTVGTQVAGPFVKKASHAMACFALFIVNAGLAHLTFGAKTPEALGRAQTGLAVGSFGAGLTHSSRGAASSTAFQGTAEARLALLVSVASAL